MPAVLESIRLCQHMFCIVDHNQVLLRRCSCAMLLSLVTCLDKPAEQYQSLVGYLDCCFTTSWGSSGWDIPSPAYWSLHVMPVDLVRTLNLQSELASICVDVCLAASLVCTVFLIDNGH